MMKRELRLAAFAVLMFVLLAASALLPASAQLSQWRSLNPTRDGILPLDAPYLYSVQMLNANYGWAVGGTCDIYGAPATCNSTNSGFALFWDGARWRQTLVPASAGSLTSVFIMSANDVWAAGMNTAYGTGATIIHWDGTSWVTAPVPANTLDRIYSIFILPGGMDGWAVGRDYTGASNILRWSGTWPTGAWSTFPSPDATRDLRGVALSSPTQGWAVGTTPAPHVGKAAIFKWDGAGWTDISATSPADNVNLHSVSIVSATDAWAVGETSTIIRWNGASWTGPMLAPVNVDYRSIHMVSTDDGWIAGVKNPATDEGVLLRWDGTAWSSVRSWVTKNLNSVFLTPGGALGASVGDAETIIRWNGSAWSAQTSPTTTDLNCVDLVSTNDGWAVGDLGRIFRWNGQSWHHYETLPSHVDLFGLFMRTSADAWAVGASPGGLTPPTILRWNGVAWSAVSPPGVALGENLTDVFMLDATWGWAVGTGSLNRPATTLKWDGTLWASLPSGIPNNTDLYSVHMLSTTDGWAVGANATGTGPVIVRWNGLVWTLVTAPTGIGVLRSVHFINANNGWAVGDHSAGQATIIHWDGTMWTRVPAPLGDLASVHLVSATDGWAVGKYATSPQSLIVHWDGLTWDVVATLPIPSTMAVNLRSVFMLASLEGWIVGDQGLILKYGPESVPGTTTSMSTSTSVVTTISTSTATSVMTTTSTTTSGSTNSTSTSTYVPPAPVPGFPIESILAGLVGGVAALVVIRRRRITRS